MLRIRSERVDYLPDVGHAFRSFMEERRHPEGVRLTRANGVFAVDITLDDAREATKFPGFRECAKDDYIGSLTRRTFKPNAFHVCLPPLFSLRFPGSSVQL